MERTFATPRRVLVNVENPVGEVVITALETTSTTVWLEATTPGAEELVESATVECQPVGDRDVVRVRIPHGRGMNFVRRNGVTVRVDMPMGGDVDVKTASADVELNGSVGNVIVKSASGDVTGDDAAGDVHIATASGDLSVEAVSGDLRVQSASGDVRVMSVGGTATVSNRSGDVEIGSVGDRADVRTASGDIRLGDLCGDSSLVGVSGDVRVLSYGAGRMHIRSVSGDITIGIPHGLHFMLDAQSLSGSVQSEIPLEDSSSRGGPGPEVEVSASTVSGDVLFERAVGALVP
jgi:hypothetical protein